MKLLFLFFLNRN